MEDFIMKRLVLGIAASGLLMALTGPAQAQYAFTTLTRI
jgi:hypothetical protein